MSVGEARGGQYSHQTMRFYHSKPEALLDSIITMFCIITMMQDVFEVLSKVFSPKLVLRDNDANGPISDVAYMMH